MSKIVNLFVDKAIAILSKYKDNQERKDYLDEIRSSYKKLSDKKQLSKEQINEIETYYQKLIGEKVPLEWHQYFYSRTGIYSKMYFPTSVYRTKIMGRLNDYTLKLAYSDKNISDLILKDAPQPKTILKNMNGYYYWGCQAVSEEEAVRLCANIGDVIIKPSLLSRGRGVQKLSLQNGINQENKQSIKDIFQSYKNNFLIQELISQHAGMEALNPSSINTIRILTYRSGMEVKPVYTVVRIGRKGQPIDNESAGGISAKIYKNGTIAKYAYGAPGVDKVEYTDSGVKLDGYQIPSFEQAIALVKGLHLNLPFFNVVGWDICISKDGSPIMIEYNVNPDLSQSANGPAFGDDTEMIVKDAMRHRNTWTRLTHDAIYKKI